MLVGGFPVRNPASLVAAGDAVAVAGSHPLRGEAKLRAALERFRIPVAGRVALDVGAAAGGFTRVLLERGACRVYAVDAGHGQLLGSLRQDARVVNLEGTNLAELSAATVTESIELVTMDLSYLSVAAAVPQLDRVEIAPGADLVALVKPQFELGRERPPMEPALLAEALRRASAGIREAGWGIVASVESPVRGARGSTEFLVHATRKQGGRASASRARATEAQAREAPPGRA